MSKPSFVKAEREVEPGTPLLKGTDVRVKMLFEDHKRGETLLNFLRDFPTVSREQAMEVLDLAANQDESVLKFEQRPDLDQLALEQGVQPVADFESLLGDFWPEDESAEDFIAQLRSWRKEERAKLKP